MFTPSTEVPRRVADPITDDTLPDPSKLDWKKITETKALAETNGFDCKLVRGDYFEHVQESAG